MSHPTRHYGVLIFGLMIVLFSSAVAEDNNTFKIESFIPEYFTDTRLSISSELNISGGDSKTSEFMEPESYNAHYDYESNSNSKNFNLGGYFSYRYETIPKYLNFSLRLSGYYGSYYNENSSNSADTAGYSYIGSSEGDEDYYEVSFEPHVDGGYYLQNDFFVSAVVDADIRYRDYPEDFYKSRSQYQYMAPDGYINSTNYSDENTSSDDTKDFFISLQLMPGWGRVYEGMFSSTAMYIVDELRNSNLLIAEPTDEQMKTLSDIIYKDMLRHYIDYRIYRMEALQAITDYLLLQNLIADSNVYQHLIIQDVWTYYPRTSRRFGFRIRGGFGLEFMHYKYAYTADFESHDYELFYHIDTLDDIDTLWTNDRKGRYYTSRETTNTYPFIGGEITYYKPYDHRWQINLSGSARYYLGAVTKWSWEETNYAIEDPSEPDTTDLTEREIELTGFYTLAAGASAVYLPSSRTTVVFSAQAGIYGFGQDVTHYEADLSDTADYTFEGPELGGQFWSRFILDINYRLAIPTNLYLRAEYNSGPYNSLNFSRRLYHNFWSSQLVNENEDYERSAYSIRLGISHYIL